MRDKIVRFCRSAVALALGADKAQKLRFLYEKMRFGYSDNLFNKLCG
jgi:hypothetical protein